ncbi:unnamed protein product [Pieris macdunnoughi]|uniref:BTB domain-containing protein n=1 Tax=Pieris macdunnoughi TaxID=345717 RepID=A0A821XJB7_9NEOP|nr:unnamed protein product [Pieris macdunnoughi]
MSRLLCCLRARHDMGAALSHPQEGEACDGGGPASPPTMADVIRERKKKSGGAGLGTLRRRIAAAARRPRDCRPDRGCEHARYIRSVVSGWRVAEVFLLCAELEAGAALRDLVTQAELAREPAAALHADLAVLLRDRVACDVEVCGAGWALPAHRLILAARCTYFRDLMHRYPKSSRVPLEGACAGLRREEGEALLLALYAGAAPPPTPPCPACRKWERGMGSEVDLDIISVENTATYRRSCSCRRDVSSIRRLSAILGFSLDSLYRDIKYLLDSGESCDARLSWRCEGGSAYGFRNALELPCHTLLLAARSPFFRSVMCRRGSTGAGAGGTVCVDEKVLPRRFAHALLHAAYTDQVDLSLISRNTSSPSTSGNSTGTASRSGRTSTTSQLDDAFQLYEIARFLEMAIVSQGCEDAILFALSPETLPHVLRWCAQPHASAWVHRQAMRYLRDEFPTIMSCAASARLPRAALAEALSSQFLQASEPQALRAALRWAERAADTRDGGSCEPNVVWHTAHSVSRRARGGRRRDVSEAGVRDALASLVPHLRTEHLPSDCDLLQQMIRRGLIPAPAHLESGVNSADAWLGRGAFRSPRCFLPYLDEIKALVSSQTAPAAELAAERRARMLHRIPDALYMLRDIAPEPRASTEHACIPPRLLSRARARVRELRATPNAARALALHSDQRPVNRQIALRAVREMSLPDGCAELLLDGEDNDRESTVASGVEGRSESRGATSAEVECCRSSTRCGSAGSLRAAPSLHLPTEPHSTGSCRRELPARPPDTPHRSTLGRLSAAVPDVAMAPNGNTHLLTPHYLYTRHAHAPRPEYGGGVGSAGSAGSVGSVSSVGSVGAGLVQLDLGDGATHTPRPGSRAQRAAMSARTHREHAQSSSCGRGRTTDDDDLRVAIELSVIRAYGSLQASSRRADLLPNTDFSALRSRASPALSLEGAVSRSIEGAAGGSMQRARSARHSPHARTLSVSGISGVSGTERVSTEREYDREGGVYSGESSVSRGRSHSPAYRS